MKITDAISATDKESLLFYVAAPYSKWPETLGFETNLDAAAWNIDRAAANLADGGLKIFSPVTQGHALSRKKSSLAERPHDFWMDFDKAFFDACDAVIVLCFSGWNESKGVLMELEWAIENETPVFFVSPSLELLYAMTSAKNDRILGRIIGSVVAANSSFSCRIGATQHDLTDVVRRVEFCAGEARDVVDKSWLDGISEGVMSRPVVPPFTYAQAAEQRRGDHLFFVQCSYRDASNDAGGQYTPEAPQKPVEGERNPKDIAGSVKPNLALNPFAAACEQALSQELGASKYGPNNWRHQHISLMTYMAAAMRHINLFINGEYWDADGKFTVVTGGKEVEKQTTNLGAAMASIAIAIDAWHNGTLIDDRPKFGIQSALYDRLKDRADTPSPSVDK